MLNMNKFSYPKLKYRAAAAPDQARDYDHVRVADEIEEDALGDGWYDTPGEMRAAAAGEAPAIPLAMRFARVAAAEYATAATPAATPPAKRKR